MAAQFKLDIVIWENKITLPQKRGGMWLHLLWSTTSSMVPRIAEQTNNEEETSRSGFTVQRKMPAFKCQCIDICTQIRHLLSY